MYVYPSVYTQFQNTHTVHIYYQYEAILGIMDVYSIHPSVYILVQYPSGI